MNSIKQYRKKSLTVDSGRKTFLVTLDQWERLLDVADHLGIKPQDAGRLLLESAINDYEKEEFSELVQ